MSRSIVGIRIPDSALAQAATATVLACEPDILFRHSMRVFLFASIIGMRRALVFDAELLYLAALYHDMGLTTTYRNSTKPFEVDGANAVQAFLDGRGVPADDVAEAWRAVALHMTFGVARYMPPVTALLSAGVETDLLGMHFDEVSHTEREAVLYALPRGAGFKDLIIEAFADGIAQRPATTFGTVNADVLERCDPNYRRANFCGLILGSNWKE